MTKGFGRLVIGLAGGILLGALGMWIAERHQFVACEVFEGSLADWTVAFGTVGALFWAIWLATAETRRRAAETRQEGLLLMALVMPELLAMRPTLAAIEAKFTKMDLKARHIPIFQTTIREIGTLIERIALPRLPSDIRGLAAINWNMGRALAVLLSNIERLRVHAKWMLAIREPREHEALYTDLTEARDLAREATKVATTTVNFIQGRLDVARASDERVE
jgi:hypothetical protein